MEHRQIASFRPSRNSVANLRENRKALEEIEAQLSLGSTLTAPRALNEGTTLVPSSICERYLLATERRDEPCSPEAAAEAGETITSLYPKGDMPDPKRFAAAIVAVFLEYPLVVVQRCAHPATGIARTNKFFPRLAEINDWCKEEHLRQRGLRHIAAWMIEEHARREEEQRIESLSRDPEVEKTVESGLRGLVAKLTAPFPKTSKTKISK